MLPALIGAGASLLGGIFGRNSEKKAIAAQNEYNKPINIRARAEEGGFNPLLFVGPGVGLQTATGGTNYMGAALADAGLALADAMSKKAELGRLEKLTEENKKLAEKVQTLTIRPKVGGVYAQREATPSLRAALGGEDVEVSGGGGVAAHSVQDGGFGVDPSDPVKPQGSHTYKTFGNDGSVTNVPLGPDFDEVVSGALIAAHNKAKAKAEFRQRNSHSMTFGEPLGIPWGLVDRTFEILPPLPRFNAAERSKHPPKPKGYQKNIYDTRSLFTQWGAY